MSPRSCLIFWVFSGALADCSAPPPEVMPAASERTVLAPSSLAVLSSSRDYAGAPSAITFGGVSGRSALYLRFPAEWRARGAPRRAFIALEPQADAPPSSEPVRIEAWRVLRDWRADELKRWSDKPELAPPYAATQASSSPASTLRLDVTELVQFAASNPELDHGIALIATGGSGHGLSFATGANGGSPPTLELYSR